ncbi:MAG TPA: CxxxxCH/CxxCH domain-containing protein, partial [Myxococcota bacterium]|nr:CxxxxCH/CxxCH domain-containing protein [Myxococcota bacterium]
AHRAHLGYSDWHAPLACDQCHRVPATMEAPGHLDSEPPAELTWGALAAAWGSAPAYDGTSCSGVYCHGAAIAAAGGAHPSPRWTQVDGSQSACGSCHALPPGGGHPQNPNCEMCHTRAIAEGRRWVDPARHIDGLVEASATACNSCHGDADSAAPPLDLQGGQDTTARGVGAHRAHLGTSDWHATLTCRECHQVPAQVGDAGHNDSSPPAELTWGPLAASGAAEPAFDGTTCSGVYCHGATLPDPNGSNVQPAWTVVDGSQAACGTCHGLPPGGTHPQAQDCHRCHGAVVAADRSFTAPERHVDGHLDLSSPHPDGYADPDQHGADFNDLHPADCAVCHGADLQGGLSGLGCEGCHPNFRTSCTFCHGGRDNQSGAPPEGVAGALNPTIRGVGAHTAHLSASSWRRAIPCGACHVIHADALDTGHIDPRPAELAWGDITQADGAQASWDGATCAGTYCHGASLVEGGSLQDPTWTRVDGTQAACGTCHGLPPGGWHPTNDQCQVCHAEVIAAGYQFLAPELHIDGQVQASGGHPLGYDSPLVHGTDALLGVMDCRTCHGQGLDGGGANQGCDQCHPAGWRTDCTFCHGGLDNQTGAPAEDLRNRTDRALQTVGAHSEHVTRTTHPAYDCVQCHQKPAALLVAGHMFDATPGVSEVRLSGGLSPAGAYAAPACNNLYCHGTGRVNRNAADFTTPITTCRACHPASGSAEADFEAMSGEHHKHIWDEGSGCNDCHSLVVNGASSIVGPDLHVNGAKNVNAPTMTWSGGRCTGTCHGETHSGYLWN